METPGIGKCPSVACTAAQFVPLTDFDSSLLLQIVHPEIVLIKFLNANPHFGVFPGTQNTVVGKASEKGKCQDEFWSVCLFVCNTHAASGDINSLTRDGNHTLEVKVQCLNHWTPGDPKMRFLKLDYLSGCMQRVNWNSH